MFFGGSGLCLSGGYVCLQWFLVGLWCGRRIDGVFLKQTPSYDIKNLCGSFFGQYLGPSRNKDPGPFTCCFKGLGLVHHS